MKYLKYFLFLLLIIPFMVLAEECDITKITITSIEQNSVEGNTEVITEPTFKDRNINLNLKMFDVGDSITYDMTIKNDSEEDYMIDEDTFETDSGYIEYSLKTNDNSNVVKAQSTKNVSLVVTYKKEIEEDILTNNKFDASNSLKLSLNTSEKEQPLDIITTDNIKESVAPQEVKNPITSVSSMLLISLILLTAIVFAYILIKRKNKYTKYIVLVLTVLLIPTVYAICTCDIEVESTIEIEKKPKLLDTIANIAKEDNSCLTKYEGKVTDQVGQTVTATKVYFDNCAEQRNVIFGGFCWQVIRTTETGGIKMIYNGEPDQDGKCLNTRASHKGIVQSGDGVSQAVDSSYLYGDTFTYDTSNNTFTLNNTTTATWSDSTYENLLGKFTCKSSSDTCTAIYQINGYDSNTSAYLSYYTIANTNYAQIGTSAFNANNNSPAMVGYMFNTVYNAKTELVLGLVRYKFGNSFTYDDSTNTYSLSGTTQDLKDIKRNTITNTHYTCWNQTGICNEIAYVYGDSNASDYYITLRDGKNVNDALDEMLSNNDVNKYNSSIKGIIDNWYAQNLSDKTNMLEDVVYCNYRNIDNIGGWNPNGGNVDTQLEFYIKDLACRNITDQFSLSNDKAKLTYPIGLLQDIEKNNINSNALLKTGDYWLTMSPNDFGCTSAGVGRVSFRGEKESANTYEDYGVRPTISLKREAIISSGTGSEEDPWIIE